MGAGGEDIQLSTHARVLFPFTVECKNRKAIAVYKDYEQAVGHNLITPLVVLKQNHSKPLALLDAEHLFDMVSQIHDLKHQIDILLLTKGK
jgi:hypothetical protein